MTFKIGDKVRIIANTNCSCNEVGDIGVVVTHGRGREYRVLVKGRAEIGNWTRFDQMELVIEEEEWSEWMSSSAAYIFLGLGRSMWSGNYRQQYIGGVYTYSFPMSRKAKPIVKQVTKYAERGEIELGTWYPHKKTYSTHRLTYNTIDGEIDCSSVKMEKLK